MNTVRQGLGACAAVTLLLAAGGCFSERSGPDSGFNPGLADCRIPLSVIDSGHVVVAIRDFTFVRDTIVVPVGSTVTWINCEPDLTEPHTTTSDTGVWGSSDLNPGARFSHTFDAAGEFPYHCTPHPFMTGKITVQ